VSAGQRSDWILYVRINLLCVVTRCVNSLIVRYQCFGRLRFLLVQH